VDEIKLFEELQPPPPRDAARMREEARARLSAATSAPFEHPARRRSTVVTVAAAAALVAGGAGYGIAAAAGGAGSGPASSTRLPITAAGLTAVQGCPGKYVTAGTLHRVSGTRLVIQPADDTGHVSVATNASTKITSPASGTVSDITDGSRVTVQGTWSGRSLAATGVEIEAGIPPIGSFGPRFPRHPGHIRTLTPPGAPPQGPPFVTGTVRDAGHGGFTVVAQNPLGRARRVRVITSSSTKVETDATATAGQLSLGANVVAVGRVGHNGVMTASTVAETSGPRVELASGVLRIRSSGCSAAAITTAAIGASG
jgi:hypothetical protein